MGDVILAGLLLGLSVAAPVGPMGLLVINRTLTQGFAAGLAIGAGIATGDALYGALAASGTSALSRFLLDWQTPLRLVGGAFLIWLGVVAWRSAGTVRAARQVRGTGLLRAYVAAVGLTLANPATILSFVAAFAALGVAASRGAFALVAGVFLGSALWWLFLCSAVAGARRAVTKGAMLWIDRFSAFVLAGFGAAAMAGLLK
jgi:threonine/homoserine/homoserine lactone efflux protein